MTDSPNQTWSEGVASAMEMYLRRDQRPHKVMVALSDTEYAMLMKASKRLKRPKASIVRAAAMLGMAAFVEARCK